MRRPPSSMALTFDGLGRCGLRRRRDMGLLTLARSDGEGDPECGVDSCQLIHAEETDRGP